MNKIIIIGLLLSVVISKDLIIVGDTRPYKMAQILFKYDVPSKIDEFTMGAKFVSSEPKIFRGYNVNFVTQCSYPPMKFSSGEISKELNNTLNKAKNGTDVLLMFGLSSNMNPFSAYKFFVEIAQKYPQLNFHVISTIGIDEKISTWTSNSYIKSNNLIIQKKINEDTTTPSNLKYKNILVDDDPTQIFSTGKFVKITNYLVDRMNFFNKEGNSLIFNAMVYGLN